MPTSLPVIVFFVTWLGLFFLLIRIAYGVEATGHARRGAETGRGVWTLPAQAIDPVCGMTVDTETAKSAIHAGAAYFFCSPACREKFESAPDRYGEIQPDSPDNPEHHHG